jgi:hypothetical protein
MSEYLFQWKNVAAYVGADEVTVRRWLHTLDFPEPHHFGRRCVNLGALPGTKLQRKSVRVTGFEPATALTTVSAWLLGRKLKRTPLLAM